MLDNTVDKDVLENLYQILENNTMNSKKKGSASKIILKLENDKRRN